MRFEATRFVAAFIACVRVTHVSGARAMAARHRGPSARSVWHACWELVVGRAGSWTSYSAWSRDAARSGGPGSPSSAGSTAQTADSRDRMKATQSGEHGAV